MHISHSIVMYGVIFCGNTTDINKFFLSQKKFNKNNDGVKSQKHT
jgi:hypothetical protein